MVGKLIILFITIMPLIVFFKNKEHFNKNLEQFSFYRILRETILTTIEQGNLSIDQIKDNYQRNFIEENNRKKIQEQKYQNLQFRREKFQEVKTAGKGRLSKKRKIVFSSIDYPFFYEVNLNYDDFYEIYSCDIKDKGLYTRFLFWSSYRKDASLIPTKNIKIYSKKFNIKDFNLETEYPFVVKLEFYQNYMPDVIDYRKDDGPIDFYNPVIYYDTATLPDQNNFKVYDPAKDFNRSKYKAFHIVLPLEFFEDTKKIIIRVNQKEIIFDSKSIFDFIFSYGFCKNANYKL